MPARPARRPFTPVAAAAEACEPRTLLTTFVVTDSGDVTDAGDGVLTYREALLAAEANAGADVITFAVDVGGVSLEADLPALTGDLSVAAGADGVTLDHAGFAGARLSGGDFAFSNVTFVNAAAENGAALDVSGGADLSVVGGAFVGNAADRSGGAVRAAGAGVTATFTGTTFDSNRARFGGAIESSDGAKLSLVDVTAVRNVGADLGSVVRSFAWENRDATDVTITGGYFALNDGRAVDASTALTVAGATFSSNDGGAIGVIGGPGAAISDSLFFRNDFSDRRFQTNEGGALEVQAAAVTVTDSTFNRNTARLGGAASVGSFTGRAASLSLVNVRMFANAAERGGAVQVGTSGTVTVEGGRYAQNRADEFGGAFYVSPASVSLAVSNVSVNRNVAGGADAANGSGGAVYASDPGFGPLEVSLDNVFAARNRAEGEFSAGGALFMEEANLTVTDSNLAGNVAGTRGGNVAFDGRRAVFTNSFLRGGRAAEGAGLFVSLGFTDDGVGADRSVVRFTGGGLVGNESTGRGGAMRVDTGFRNPNFVTLDGVRVRGNRAADGGVAYLQDGRNGSTGGSRLDVTGGTVLRNNRASGRGGAFAVESRLILDDVLAVGNRANRGGAAFAFDDGRVSVADAVFRDNGDDPLAGPGDLDA